MLSSRVIQLARRVDGWAVRSMSVAPGSHKVETDGTVVQECSAKEHNPPGSKLEGENAERKQIIDTMIRVDHAGELGAARIYSGQLAVFGGTPIGKVLQEMKDQEQNHLDTFDRLIKERRVRPTALMPIWNVAGYALGLSTALVGKEAAMACTVAVEEVIADHYNDQVRKLLEEGFEDEADLRATFRQFRDEELEHKHTGLEHDAERAPMYRAMSEVIKAGCRGAIFLTQRI